MTRAKKGSRAGKPITKAEKKTKPVDNAAGPSTPDAAGLIGMSTLEYSLCRMWNITLIVEKAHILLGQSNFDLAIKFLERALALEPENLESRELLGVAELEGGDPDVGREVSISSLKRMKDLADGIALVTPLPTAYDLSAI